MASEQVVISFALFSVSLLWFSNELTKRNSLLWAQAFQVISFLFMLVTFTISAQFLRADTFFDMEDVVFVGPFYIISTLIWVIVFFWIFSMVVSFVTSLGKPKLESINQKGGNKYGP